MGAAQPVRDGSQTRSDTSAVRIGLLLPDVLGTYSDSGNATVLAKRLEWRGVATTVVPVRLGEPVPASLDLYMLGGGEDDAQALAAARLRASPGLRKATARGSVVLGICAGFQILGRRFTTSDRVEHTGLELLDAATVPGTRRAVGEVVAHVDATLGGQPLTGFENHQGHTELGPDGRPLGRVTRGVGNGDGTEGALSGRVIGTYLHGPVLARNPALADLLLSWVLGTPPRPLELPEVTELRRERLAHDRVGIRARS
ncbi:glutamine amidotransferase [Saccharomonospora sp. NPDC046836]|uniref:type 1 glutamine amidotransferase n=1 Tax=Saccharomonospora sp. NPDC046836 TaxID=3156921 RepID=UPI00340AC793